MIVKVCGIRDERGARACAEAGVDLVGFNLVPGSRRAVTRETLARLRPLVGEAVGVFRDQPPDEVLRQSEGLDWVQLHGSEPPELCARLRIYRRVIKALGPRALAQIPDYVGAVDVLLLDGDCPGSGRARAWVVPPCALPVLLAGGLTPENVGRAISIAQPAGVDTASGVEVLGAVDPARLRAFVAAARAAGGGP